MNARLDPMGGQIIKSFPSTGDAGMENSGMTTVEGKILKKDTDASLVSMISNRKRRQTERERVSKNHKEDGEAANRFARRERRSEVRQAEN